MNSPRTHLQELFAAAVAAAQPSVVVPRALPPKPAGRIRVIGVGKAAAAMAVVVEQAWGPEVSGLVITRYGHRLPTKHIVVREAAHPLSDQAGYAATQALKRELHNLKPNDLVLGLFSGGGSALLADPAAPLTLADWNQVNQGLLQSGATIQDINRVRKHLSAINGGRLAQLCFPAAVVGLVLSDIPGDDLAMVASGPLSGEDSTPEEALAILERYQIALPERVRAHLVQSTNRPLRTQDPMIQRVSLTLVGSASLSLQAAAAKAKQLGLEPWIVSDALTGEAVDVGRTMAACVDRVRSQGRASAPWVILSGGESTVTLRQPGRGGRNTEALLSAALAFRGQGGVHALFADTDGIDGTEHNAGAFADGQTISRLNRLGVSADHCLNTHHAFDAFAALNDLFVTGPTHTNVNDFRAILVEPA